MINNGVELFCIHLIFHYFIAEAMPADLKESKEPVYVDQSKYFLGVFTVSMTTTWLCHTHRSSCKYLAVMYYNNNNNFIFYKDDTNLQKRKTLVGTY